VVKQQTQQLEGLPGNHPRESANLSLGTKFLGGACTVGARILRKDFVMGATPIVSTTMSKFEKKIDMSDEHV
jgi:hypothetical protein